MDNGDEVDARREVAAQRKGYRVLLEDWRCALTLSADVKDAELRVALLMLQCSNRKEFYASGRLVSWLGAAGIARALQTSEKTVQRARAGLQLSGVIECLQKGRGGGRGHDGEAPIFSFVNEWLDKRSAEIDQSGRADAFAGQIRFISEKRRTSLSPSSGSAPQPGKVHRGGHRTSRGGHFATNEADTVCPPTPIDITPENRPPSEAKLQGDAIARAADINWYEDTLAWVRDVSAQQDRTEQSIIRVLNALAKEHGVEIVTEAIDRILMTCAEGIDPIGLLNAFIRQVEER